MKKEIAEQWVAALRSGDYKQGNGRLRTGDKFCCLGVLCNLHAQAHPEIAAPEKDPSKYLNSTAWLPFKVKDWAGLQSERGGCESAKFTPRGAKHSSLASANDGRVSFANIANFIEKNYEEL